MPWAARAGRADWLVRAGRADWLVRAGRAVLLGAAVVADPGVPGPEGVLVAPAVVVVSVPMGPAFPRAPVVSAVPVGLAAVVDSVPVGPVVSPAPAGRRGGVVRGPLPAARGRRSGRGR
ncbi:hypothetical protein [Streptomyces sparsogenes]|uniref:hypothetical protein n=1 Tax=Streptomyces sparsogenes TaxID=67365 RepID=UPI000826B1C9